jgi:hypothetical protein
VRGRFELCGAKLCAETPPSSVLSPRKGGQRAADSAGRGGGSQSPAAASLAVTSVGGGTVAGRDIVQ